MMTQWITASAVLVALATGAAAQAPPGTPTPAITQPDPQNNAQGTVSDAPRPAQQRTQVDCTRSPQECREPVQATGSTASPGSGALPQQSR